MTTAIEWTDETWNPVTGCTKVSPGCKFCYAERVAKRYWGARKFTDVRVHEDRLDAPLRWRRPRRVFVNSMSDLFHEAVPDEFIDRVFAVMALAPAHIFQVLTKRPERMAEYVTDLGRSSKRIESACPVGYALRWEGFSLCSWPLPNLHLGVSVEDQPRADERIPWLLQTPAAVRFLSIEPLLGPVTIWGPSGPTWNQGGGIDWVIVGGESGGPPERALVERCLHCHGRRVDRCSATRDPFAVGACDGSGWVQKPEALSWVRSLRDQCVAAGVPFFFKQWGGPTPKAGGRLLDGRKWSEYPK